MTASARKGRALYYWVYPNLMLNWYEGYLDTNLVLPLGVDRVKVIFDFYFDDITRRAPRQHAQHGRVRAHPGRGRGDLRERAARPRLARLPRRSPVGPPRGR